MADKKFCTGNTYHNRIANAASFKFEGVFCFLVKFLVCSVVLKNYIKIK